MTLGIHETSADGEKIVPNPKILSKNEKLRQKKKAAIELKRSVKANLPPKEVPEMKLPASFVLPKQSTDLGRFADDENLLNEIKRRTNERNALTLRVKPVPSGCPPAVLQDFCPSAIFVRPPDRGSRLAFLEFRSKMDTQSALLKLNGQELDGKTVQVTCCGDRTTSNEPIVVNGLQWKTVDQRTIEDVDLQCLYVSCLPRSVLRTDLAQLFRTAVSIKLPTLPDTTCAGHCLLRFKSREEAIDVFENLHHTVMRGIPIYVNFKLRNKNAENRAASNRKNASLKRAADSPAKSGSLPEKRARQLDPISNERTSAELKKRKKNRTKKNKLSKQSPSKVVSIKKPFPKETSISTSPKKKKNRKNKIANENADFSVSKSPLSSKQSDPQLKGHQLTKKSENRKKKQKKSA